MDHQLQCPTGQVAMYESLKVTCIKQALKSGDTKTSDSPSESPRIKEESS